MRYDPHMLLEGIIIACWAMQAHTSYIYVRGEFTEPQRGWKQQSKRLTQKTCWGPHPRHRFSPSRTRSLGRRRLCVRGETALINSLEGKKGQPESVRLPSPAGVFDMPTTVNNVESIASTLTSSQTARRLTGSSEPRKAGHQALLRFRPREPPAGDRAASGVPSWSSSTSIAEACSTA